MKRHPLVEEIRTPLSAAEAFSLFHQEFFAFFLDSGMDPTKLGRYSFIGCNPFLVLKNRGNELTFLNGGHEERRRGNLFRALGELLEECGLDSGGVPTPLVGGAVGYLSYDLCHFIENVPTRTIDDLQLPECCLGFYDVVVTFDHLEQRTYIASSGFPEQEESHRLKRARERLEQIKAGIADARPRPPDLCPPLHTRWIS